MALHLGDRKKVPSKKKKEPRAAYGSAEHRRKISEGLKRHHAAKRKGKVTKKNTPSIQPKKTVDKTVFVHTQNGSSEAEYRKRHNRR